ASGRYFRPPSIMKGKPSRSRRFAVRRWTPPSTSVQNSLSGIRTSAPTSMRGAAEDSDIAITPDDSAVQSDQCLYTRPCARARLTFRNVSAQRHGLGRGLTSIGDGATDALDRRDLHVTVKMRVPARCLYVPVPEQAADQRQRGAAAHQLRRE